jgi:hypothetical protein
MTEESLVARYNTVEARWLASPLCIDYTNTIGEKPKHARLASIAASSSVLDL